MRPESPERHAFISRRLIRSAVAMRVGVIGVGAMGQNHARVYAEIADVVGIADPDVKAGGAVSNRFNVSYFTDHRSLLKEDLDAVSVCVPTHLHAAVARDVTASARRVSSFPGRVRGVGVVMDLGVHDIDIMRYLVGGPIESVFALGGRKMHEKFEDHANILLKFANGVNGFVEVNYTEQSITVSASTLGPLDPFNLYQLPLEHHSQQIHVRKEEPLKRELEDFLAAVRDKRAPLVTGEDALETLRVAEGATESHRKGQVVRLL